MLLSNNDWIKLFVRLTWLYQNIFRSEQELSFYSGYTCTDIVSIINNNLFDWILMKQAHDHCRTKGNDEDHQGKDGRTAMATNINSGQFRWIFDSSNRREGPAECDECFIVLASTCIRQLHHHRHHCTVENAFINTFRRLTLDFTTNN